MILILIVKAFLILYYDRFHLYYIDFNYQFSLIYYYFVNTGNILPPESQTIMGMFMGIFNLRELVDQDINMILNASFYKTVPILDYLNGRYLIFFWLMLGFFSLLLSIRLLIKRD